MKPSDARATATGVTNEEKSNDTDDSHPENKSSQRKRAREETPEGDRDNAETAKNPAIDAAHAPKITSDGMVEFSLAAIHKHLVCGLCSGYLKDPYKITECLHTYCKSCLFYSIACGCHECPKCNVYLGTDPTRIAVLDHSMQDVSFVSLPRRGVDWKP